MTREELIAAWRAYLSLEQRRPKEGEAEFCEWQAQIDEVYSVLAEYGGPQRPEGATIQ